MKTKSFHKHLAIYNFVRNEHSHTTMDRIIHGLTKKIAVELEFSTPSASTVRKYVGELTKIGILVYDTSNATYSVSESIEFDHQLIDELHRANARPQPVKRKITQGVPGHAQIVVQGAKNIPALGRLLVSIGLDPEDSAHLYAATIAVEFADNEIQAKTLMGRLASLVSLVSHK